MRKRILGIFLIYFMLTISSSCNLINSQQLENNNWGYIDKAGRFIINPQFAVADDFSDGFAAVKLKKDGPKGEIITVVPLHKELAQGTLGGVLSLRGLIKKSF